MKRANLIPAARIQQRSRLRRIRSWAAALAVYAVLTGGAYAACLAMGGDDREDLMRKMRESTQRFREAGKEIHVLRGSLAEASKQIAVARSLSQNPDWSLLLAMVSRNLDDDVVLERCTLTPMDSSGGGSDSGRAQASPAVPAELVLHQRYALDLAGFSRTQSGVSQFVLRLEQSRLFEKVRLIKTQKRSFSDAEAVSFRIECMLNGSGGSQQ